MNKLKKKQIETLNILSSTGCGSLRIEITEEMDRGRKYHSRMEKMHNLHRRITIILPKNNKKWMWKISSRNKLRNFMKKCYLCRVIEHESVK